MKQFLTINFNHYTHHGVDGDTPAIELIFVWMQPKYEVEDGKLVKKATTAETRIVAEPKDLINIAAICTNIHHMITEGKDEPKDETK